MNTKHLSRLGAVALGLCMLSPLATFAADTPQWIRYPAISPDGEAIAFTYRGQIYMVDAEGGLAIPLTSQGYYSYGPVWSPDSEQIAFATDINGDDDVYVTDFSTNLLKRLTWSSAGEVPTGFSPDGKTILFTARRLGDPVASVQTSAASQVYSVSTDGDNETLVLPNLAKMAVWNSDGSKLLYTFDPSVDPESRQHRVTGNARQIWLYDAEGGKHTHLLKSEADMLNPVWGPEDASFYYLGEASGSLNVWKYDFASGENQQITQFTDFPVRYLSVSAAGDIAFAYNGKLYRIAANEAEPKQLEVSVPEQLMDQPERQRTSSTREFVSSPNGSHFAAIINADVFLIDRSGGVRQITRTAEEERDVAFSPDGSMLVYASQRDHKWGIYGVNLLFDDEGGVTVGDEQQVIDDDAVAFAPAFSPDGTKLAYVADRREVKVFDSTSGEITTLFQSSDYNTSYGDGDQWFNWAPNSQSLTVPWKQVPFSMVEKVGIVPVDGSAPIKPLSLAINTVSQGVWSADGTHFIALTPMFSLRTIDQSAVLADLYQVFMSDEARSDFLDAYEERKVANADESETQDEDENGEAQEGETESSTSLKTYDFQEPRPSYLERRLTTFSRQYVLASPLQDGRNILTVSLQPDGDVLIEMIDLRTQETTEILELTSADGLENLESVQFLPQQGVLDFKMEAGVLTIPLADVSQRNFLPISVDYRVQPSLRRNAAFEQVWADIHDKFYLSAEQRRDWDSIGENYRAFLSSIGSDRELRELVDEMLGELSASHLFVSSSTASQRENLETETGALGFYPDYTYIGEGVRIAAILPGGPLSRTSFAVEAGETILSVNGEQVRGIAHLDSLLDGTAGNMVKLVLRSTDEDERTLQVRPINLETEINIAYFNWIDSRRQMVNELSNGCIAYQYLPEMNNASYVDAYGRLLASNYTAKAALIDVRSNMGGNLHRQLLTFLTGVPYAQVGLDDRPWEVEPLDRWTKPSAVLVDSFAYSDGSVFPQAYQDSDIGPLVGDILIGTGTGVNFIDSRILPGFRYGIPVQPFRRLDGSYYENRQILPDILVPYDPNTLGEGRDLQLEAAVEALLKQVQQSETCK